MNKSPVLVALGGLLAMAIGIGIGRFVYTPILPAMVEALGLSKSEAGLLASANFAGYLAGALVAIRPLPGSRRAWLLGGLLATALSLAAMGMTTSMAAFLALRLIAGVTGAFTMVFASGLVLDRLAATGRGGLSSVHFAGVGAGIAASAAIVAPFADWRDMWFASAALAGAALLAVAWLVPADTTGTRRAVATDKVPAALVVAYGLFGFAYIITATFIVAEVRGTPAIARLEPVIWVLFGLSAAPSVALWSSLAARWGALRTFAIASFIEAVSIAGSVLWVSDVTIVAAAILVGGTFMGMTALGLLAARGHIALMTASFGLGQIVGPVFAGYLYDLTGSLTLPSLAAAAALVAAGALVVRLR
ncbi:MAG: YbfB/YjiJ family MFS transporter [Enhydrobacter sp.]|nr:MAG: YbfB/YjiJ family MFS transporter [Enhydrobacter sp.]